MSQANNVDIRNPMASSGEVEDGNEGWAGMEMYDPANNPSDRDEPSRDTSLAMNLSWFVNITLLAIKIVAFVVSSSKAVLASLVDSIVDLLSQAVLYYAEKYISEHSPDYPVGRSRLEALSVIACAFIMSMASVEVVQFSIEDLNDGFTGHKPHLVVDVAMYSILSIGIFFKFFLWLYCLHVNKTAKSDTIHALAEDHLNDVMSNSFAVVAAGIAYNFQMVWWLDPIGAILISVVIIYRWYDIISEQVKKIVGHTAPPEFIESVQQLALDHDPRLAVDCLRAYHFGVRYNVELEIVLPGSMTVAESHDLALALQHKIELLEDVERAFVHVDHLHRDGLEHKVERELHLSKKAKNGDGHVASAQGHLSRVYNQLRSRMSHRRHSGEGLK